MRWNAEAYDPILIRLHKRGMTDRAITGFMLDQHLPAPLDDVRLARRRLGLDANKRLPALFAEPPSRLPGVEER